MVNKILKVGNQIVSLGGGVVNTPNPELEVQDILDTNRLSGNLSTDVKKGDLVIRKQGVGDFTDDYVPEGFNWRARLFVRDNELQCVSHNGSNQIEYWYYDTDTSGWRHKHRTSNPNNNNFINTTRSYDGNFKQDDEGNFMLPMGHHWNTYRAFGGYLFYEDEPHNWSTRSMNLDDYDDWPKPLSYTGTGNVYQYITEPAACGYVDGQWHYFMGYQVSTTYDQNTIDTDFGGLSNFRTYIYDTSADSFTLTTHDPSGWVRHDKHAADMIEVSGQGWMAVGGYEVHAPSFNFDSSSIPDGNYISVAFFKWNSSTQNWDFHSWNKSRVYGGFFNCEFQLLEDGTFILNTGKTGTPHMHCPMKYDPVDDSWDNWGQMDITDMTRPNAYNSSRVFIANDKYYLVYGGTVRRDWTDSNQGTTSWNGSSTVYNSYLKIAEYNPTTDYWEQLDTKFHWSCPRNAPTGSNFVHSEYVRSIDVIKHNGEIHIVACGLQYAESIKFWKFNAATEEVVEYPKPYMVHLATRDTYTIPTDYTQSGITYRATAFNEYPYMGVMEWDGSSWSRDWFMDYPDRNLYFPQWYESSNGDLYVFAGHNDTAEEIALFKYDKLDKQLKRIAFTDWMQGTAPTQPCYYGMCLFNTGSNTYLISHGQNRTHNLYEVFEDASGVPYVQDKTGVTLPTYTYGNTNITGGNRSIVWNNRLWIGHASYDSPYGTEFYSWDGSSATFDEHSLSSVRGDVYEQLSVNQGTWSRTRTGVSFQVWNNELWAVHAGDGWPRFYWHKYNPADDAFHEPVFTPYISPTTPYQRPISTTVWNDKLYIFFKNYQGYKYTNSLVEYDGSSNPKQYPLMDLSPTQYPEAMDAVLTNSPQGDLELMVYPRNLGTGRAQRCYRINQSYLDNGGYHWGKLKNNDQGGLTNPEIGVALEDGNKGDTIAIQRYKL